MCFSLIYCAIFSPLVWCPGSCPLWGGATTADQLFDALVHMRPLVAVNTLDLGEYLLLQVGQRKATPGGDETGVLDSSDISNQLRA